MTKILSIGEIMLEMSDVGGGVYKKSFAGDTFNMAHYLNVVTRGEVRADYLTAVGVDAESDACLAFLENMGAGTSRCLRLPEYTLGLFILTNDESGEKQYGYWRGMSAAKHVFDTEQDLAGYDFIYLSGITAAITLNKENLVASVAAARKQGAMIVYDFNHRKLLWTPEEARTFADAFLSHVDIVKISDEELEVLYAGRKMDEFSKLYPEAEWVLTCEGNKGEVWKAGNLIAQQIFEPVEKVVDSSAAGDSFIAAYLAAKFNGAEPLEGLQRGHAIASQVVCGVGSIVAIDTSKLD